MRKKVDSISQELGEWLKKVLAGFLNLGHQRRIAIDTVASETWRELKNRMRQDWDERARENPLYYIATNSADSEEVFSESGEITLEKDILPDIQSLVTGESAVLEIGCGIGRVLRPLARRFRLVYGVDVSPEMVRLAQTRLADLENVKVFVNNGSDLRPIKSGQVELAISYLVFQHIPDREIIRSLIRDTFRVLKPGGIFKFQVRGRPNTEEAEAQERIREKDTWYGATFSEPEIRQVIQDSGFVVLSTYTYEVLSICHSRPPESWFLLWTIAQKP